jgi:hypothetical protein
VDDRPRPIIRAVMAEELTSAMTPTVSSTTDSMTSIRVNPRCVRTLISAPARIG